ncbi:transglutaminase domain-containing protein [Methanobrevibacter millerae]|uniref:Transglutaminase-like enzyme, putative cysteine protease n=1 Tax=Methanobrevibacter millerae TaxID=230361 RepID=A0A1G5UU54_9EURY|nr:Ig-like domain repeat protein [Methanobrevibacter millerae]SDA37151.1 Transglutaminase-like enzyme, putative cysteine protease [Methanobrevibacter millerae]
MGSLSAADLNDTCEDYVSGTVFQEFHSLDDDVTANGTIPTSLAGNDTEMYFGSGESFKVSLTDVNGTALSNESVIFTINANNYTRTTDVNGTASIKINLNSGSYNVTSYFAGTDIYSSSNTSHVINVLSTILGDDIEKFYKNDTQYYATFKDSSGNLLVDTNVTFNINGVYYERKTNEKGTARLNINLNSGKYILTAINPANGEMHSNNVTVISTLYGSDVVKYYKNDTQYYVTLVNGEGKPLANQKVTFNINGVYYERTADSNGIARMNINLNPGNYTITAISSFNNEMHSNNIEVLPTISAEDLTMNYKDGSRFCANVLDDNGNPLAKSDVVFNINGVYYTRTSDNEGNAYLNINLEVGSYVITATNNKGLSVSKTIKINKGDSTIKASDAHIIVGVDRDYTVTLMGVNNKTVPLNLISFRYNGVNVNAVSNENGEATIVISNLSEGNYTLECEFRGNGNYNPCKSSVNLTVENATNRLFGSDLKMYYHDGSRFTVALTDLKSHPMANETITFNINGNLYNRTTDSRGIAGLNINLNPGTYKISYSYCVPDSPDYNRGSNTIVVSKIPVNMQTSDLTFIHGEKGVFTATLIDYRKSPLEGFEVTFSISGKTYKRITNASGVASLNINLPVGYYEISTSFDNVFYTPCSASNHVLVDGATLVAYDVTIYPGYYRDYSVWVYDAYGKPIENADIEFIYNGVSKHALTDDEGIATASVGGMAKGEYVVVYKYAERNTAGQAHLFVSEQVLNTKNTIEDLTPYLIESINCQVSNPEIVSLANRLTSGLTSSWDKAKAIYNYVRDAISYGYYYDTKYGAVGTLHSKVGNCVDQSHLSIALYRAAGLPARYVHGKCTFGDGRYGHVWVQVLIGDTWVAGDTISSKNSLGVVNNWNNYDYKHYGYFPYIVF